MTGRCWRLGRVEPRVGTLCNTSSAAPGFVAPSLCFAANESWASIYGRLYRTLSAMILAWCYPDNWQDSPDFPRQRSRHQLPCADGFYHDVRRAGGELPHEIEFTRDCRCVLAGFFRGHRYRDRVYPDGACSVPCAIFDNPCFRMQRGSTHAKRAGAPTPTQPNMPPLNPFASAALLRVR